jgi:hypothetical protein
MAESTTTDAPPSGGKGKGGIKAFIRRNKTLSAVAGVGGIYFLWKMRQEPAGEVKAIGEGEGEEGAASGLGGTAELAAYEVGRAERAQERTAEDLEELETESRERENKAKEEKQEAEEERQPGGSSKEPEPGPSAENPSPETNVNPAEPASIRINGKVFKGATSSHIAKAGKTTGGLEYVEYAIQFPGRVEHWQYFTSTGNWRQVKNSAGGVAANNNKPGTKATTHPPKPGAGTTKSPPRKSQAKIGSGHALPAPSKPSTAPVAAQHPLAVNTGNRCVSGGIGPHTAPPGYHLFCQNGYIWRAPNA